MGILEELMHQKIADALEVIVDLCDYYNSSCLDCPLAVKSDYDGDDYCIFDCNNQAMRMRVEEIRDAIVSTRRLVDEDEPNPLIEREGNGYDKYEGTNDPTKVVVDWSEVK